MQDSVSAGYSRWIGVLTLYRREVARFVKVWNQTVLAPMVTTLLFLAIFMLALGGDHRVVEGIPFAQFIIPGLIMMAVVQNAFANSSSSLMLSKIQGVIIDVLMPPFSPHELTLAYMLGGMTRGVLVCVSVSAAVWFFVPYGIAHPLLAIYYVLIASALMALIGILTGIWAQSFDQMSSITNYIITPLAFLSGTFYSVGKLPEPWHTVSAFDPFFYMIDGFRYALTGHHDGNIALGMGIMAVSSVVMYLAVVALFRSGYRLKS